MFWNGRNEWKQLDGVEYLNNPVYQNVKTGELAWEDRDILVTLPAEFERQLRERFIDKRQKTEQGDCGGS